MKDYLIDIGQLYGNMLDNIITEKTQKFPGKGTFEMADKAKAKKHPFVGKKSGPEAAEGVKKPAKAPAKFSMSSEKTQNVNINNHMSKNFDKLISDVLNGRLQLEAPEADALDKIAAEPEAGIDAMGGGEGEGMPGEGEVGEGEGEEMSEFENATPSEIIQHIQSVIEVLARKCEEFDLGSEGEGMPGEGEGEGMPGEGEGEGMPGEEVAREATHLETLPDSKGKSLEKGKGNKMPVVPGNASKTAKGKANAKVTDTVGTEETGIHPLVSPERMNKGLTGKNNKVQGATAGKVGYQIGQ
jgi:hypothetical protein